MTDYVPMLGSPLQDKSVRGEHIAAVFLMLDADLFGTHPWTDNNIDSFLPPGVGDESQWRFWWRYLTVFQFTDWRRYVSRALAYPLPPTPILARYRRPPLSGWSLRRPLRCARCFRSLTARGGRHRRGRGRRTAEPAHLKHQLGLLKRFIALCRENRIRLVVAFSPLNPRNEYAGDAQTPDNERIVAMVAQITPVWDLAVRPGWRSVRTFGTTSFTSSRRSPP